VETKLQIQVRFLAWPLLHFKSFPFPYFRYHRFISLYLQVTPEAIGMENVAIIVLLLFGVAFMGMISNRYRFPVAVVWVLSGLLISFIPQLPLIELSPEVVFLMFLPPLLYSSAWNTSWHDFKANLRPIGLAAIGLVLVTTFLVALAAYYCIPGIGWPEALLIGAIVSPPDAVAATSITKGLGLNPRLITILEGESLVNDASGLVAYKYALIAVSAGNFILWKAGLNFVVIAVAGIAIGLAIGYIMYVVHRRFVNDPVLDTTLTFLTPFASYLLAESFHFSGVLAVVSTGLYLSYQSAHIFTHQSRIMAYAVWRVVIYILNGLVFVLIGLQLRHVVQGISSEYSVKELLLYGAIISLAVILVRFIWILPAIILPRVFGKLLCGKMVLDGRNWTIFGWAGMRGVVSMAAALAMPIALTDGRVFEHRNLIIYLTFCVILSTLVVLGLSLPWLIRKLKIDPYSMAEEEYRIRTEVVNASIQHIEENLALLNDELLNNIKSKYEVKYVRLQKTDLPSGYFGGEVKSPDTVFKEFTKLQLDMLEVERQSLNQLHRSGSANEEVLRKIEFELDLEETRLKMDYDMD
jgi:CPA1 family monovalent cation:H+ antiporter